MPFAILSLLSHNHAMAPRRNDACVDSVEDAYSVIFVSTVLYYHWHCLVFTVASRLAMSLGAIDFGSVQRTMLFLLAR
jgi:hypothetical protein